MILFNQNVDLSFVKDLKFQILDVANLTSISLRRSRGSMEILGKLFSSSINSGLYYLNIEKIFLRKISLSQMVVPDKIIFFIVKAFPRLKNLDLEYAQFDKIEFSKTIRNLSVKKRSLKIKLSKDVGYRPPPQCGITFHIKPNSKLI